MIVLYNYIPRIGERNGCASRLGPGEYTIFHGDIVGLFEIDRRHKTGKVTICNENIRTIRQDNCILGAIIFQITLGNIDIFRRIPKLDIMNRRPRINGPIRKEIWEIR